MPGLDLVRLFGAAQFSERDAAKRSIPVLRDKRSPESKGLDKNNAIHRWSMPGPYTLFLFKSERP